MIVSSIARDRDAGNPFHCSYDSRGLLSEFSSRKLNYFKSSKKAGKTTESQEPSSWGLAVVIYLKIMML